MAESNQPMRHSIDTRSDAELADWARAFGTDTQRIVAAVAAVGTDPETVRRHVAGSSGPESTSEEPGGNMSAYPESKNGSRGSKSGINIAQSRAIGQDSPLEGCR